MKQVATAALVLVLAGLLDVAPAHAAEPGDRGMLDDRLTLSLGTFLLSTRTRIGVNGSAGQRGTTIDLERDLGIRPGDRFRVDLNWRITGRHLLRAAYFDYGMEAARSVNRELGIRDTLFPVRASLSVGFGTRIFELAYEYAFLERQDWELLGTFGAHMLQFDLDVSGQADVGGQSSVLRSESVSTQAPLPVVGLRYLWRFAPQWYFDAQAQYFQASIDDLDGNILDLRAGVNWKFSRHFGVGLGYSRFRTEVDATLRHFSGTVDWRYSGAQAYVFGSF